MNLRLLIVDDEEIILQGIRAIVERETTLFQEILCAKHAEEGLELARQQKPDIVITDINMPGKNGIEFIRDMKREGLCERFIILTGYDEFEYARQALRLHVIDFLIKPINKEELFHILEKTATQMDDERTKQREAFALKLKNVLLYSAPMDEVQIDSLELETFFPYSYFQVAVIHCKHHEFTLTDYQKFHSFVREHYPESFIFTSKHMPYIVFLFNVQQELKQSDQKLMYELLISNDLSLNLHLHLGFSSVSQDQSKLHYLYIEALKASYLNVMMLKTPYASFYSTDKNLSVQYYDRMIEHLDSSNETLATRYIKEDIEHFLSDKKKDLSYAKKIYLYYLVHFSVYLGTFGLNGEEILSTSKQFDRLHVFKTKDEIIEQILLWTTRVYRAVRHQEQPNVTLDTVDKILVYIHQYYMEPLSLDRIADETNLHPHYVSSLFKKEKGISFLQYLNQYRIEKAKQLLVINGELPIKDIWGQVGFESENHFYKLFKKHTGLTPKDFRDSMKVYDNFHM